MSERGYDIHGRTEVTLSKGRTKYRHQFEHRGSGIVAIYSYGRSGDHGAIVREAGRIMRDRFGVSGAVSSGGISGWPKDAHKGSADYNDRTVETQTIFCIHAVGGPNRPKLKQVAPGQADWHLNYTLDNGQPYLADGDVDAYFTGPLEDEEFWTGKILEWTEGGGEIVELTVRALAQGRYWFLADGDPVVETRNP